MKQQPLLTPDEQRIWDAGYQAALQSGTTERCPHGLRWLHCRFCTPETLQPTADDDAEALLRFVTEHRRNCSVCRAIDTRQPATEAQTPATQAG